MEGKIKVIQGVYPVSVSKAIYLDDGKTNLNDLEQGFRKNIINLYNWKTVQKGGYYHKDTGVFTASTSHASSDFIKVDYGKTYSQKVGLHTTFWNENKEYVSGFNNKTTFTIDNKNIKYVKITLEIAVGVRNYMLVESNTYPDEVVLYEAPKFMLKTDYIEIPGLEKDKNYANGKVPLFIETNYNEGNQITHPDVHQFDEAWNGYKYWMVYTPYPLATTGFENPSIAVSNDGIKWVKPNGVTNPIIGPSESFTNVGDCTFSYNSDGCIFYNSDTSKLEVWVRSVFKANSGGGEKVNLYRKTSSDGINWSALECVYAGTGGTHPISQSVIYEDGKYKMWANICNYTVGYMESTDCSSWTSLSCNGLGKVWHLCVKKYDGVYEMLVMNNGGSTMPDNSKLDFYTSTDGINWVSGHNGEDPTIINSTGRKQDIDGLGLYRSTHLKIDGCYYVIYGTYNHEKEWRLSLSIAEEPNNIHSLKGIDDTYVCLMDNLKRKYNYAKVGDCVFDVDLGKPVWCKTGGKNSVWVDSTGTKV